MCQCFCNTHFYFMFEINKDIGVTCSWPLALAFKVAALLCPEARWRRLLGPSASAGGDS